MLPHLLVKLDLARWLNSAAFTWIFSVYI